MMMQNSALRLREDSSKLLPKGEEEKVAGLWGLQPTLVASHLPAFILLLRPKGEIRLLAVLASG